MGENTPKANTGIAINSKKIALVIICCLIVIALSVFILLRYLIPSYNYSKAIQLKESGKYDMAISVFKSLQGYKDSDLQIIECKEDQQYGDDYNKAIALAQDGKYTEAIEIFKSLGGYKDSEEQIINAELDSKYKAKYNEALRLRDAERLEEAVAILETLEGYKDSKQIEEDLRSTILYAKYEGPYKEAVSLISSERYDDALAILKALEGYKDSAQLISDVSAKIDEIRYEKSYQEAVSLFNAEDYERSRELFISLGQYKDSVSKLMICEEKIAEKKALREAFISQFELGKTVSFGTYSYTASGENKPISWLVIARENDRALLLSEYAIDSIKFNSDYAPVCWGDSSSRQWLNKTFYNSAFTTEEKSLILTNKTEAEKNILTSRDSGVSTEDKVFLLSISEVKEYLPNSTRCCAPTSFAKAQSVYESNDGKCWWWL